jgi:hypothetical protein
MADNNDHLPANNADTTEQQNNDDEYMQTYNQINGHQNNQLDQTLDHVTYNTTIIQQIALAGRIAQQRRVKDPNRQQSRDSSSSSSNLAITPSIWEFQRQHQHHDSLLARENARLKQEIHNTTNYLRYKDEFIEQCKTLIRIQEHDIDHRNRIIGEQINKIKEEDLRRQEERSGRAEEELRRDVLEETLLNDVRELCRHGDEEIGELKDLVDRHGKFVLFLFSSSFFLLLSTTLMFANGEWYVIAFPPGYDGIYNNVSKAIDAGPATVEAIISSALSLLRNAITEASVSSSSNNSSNPTTVTRAYHNAIRSLQQTMPLLLAPPPCTSHSNTTQPTKTSTLLQLLHAIQNLSTLLCLHLTLSRDSVSDSNSNSSSNSNSTSRSNSSSNSSTNSSSNNSRNSQQQQQQQHTRTPPSPTSIIPGRYNSTIRSEQILRRAFAAADTLATEILRLYFASLSFDDNHPTAAVTTATSTDDAMVYAARRANAILSFGHDDVRNISSHVSDDDDDDEEWSTRIGNGQKAITTTNTITTAGGDNDARKRAVLAAAEEDEEKTARAAAAEAKKKQQRFFELHFWKKVFEGLQRDVWGCKSAVAFVVFVETLAWVDDAILGSL